MPVAITWSTTENGSAISGNVVHTSGGAITNGVVLDQEELWIRHDGNNNITGCGFYIGEFSGTYSGATSAALDLAEMLSWGDGSTANAFGGFQLNMNGGDANPGDWPVWNGKQPTNGSAFFTGVGDSTANKVLLKTTMGTAVTSDGVLAASDTDAQMYTRIEVPTDEDTVGKREFDQRLRYTFTS